MDNLDVEHLLPLMPQTVLEEFLQHGDASKFGFSPGVEIWLKTCTHPRVEKWRDDLKRETMRRIRVALQEQATMSEYAQEAYQGAKGSIRPRAVIHPTIKRWMETIHGKDTFRNRESIADTEKQAPKLFVNK